MSKSEPSRPVASGRSRVLPRRSVLFPLLALSLAAASSCATSSRQTAEKIRFDIASINKDGLTGPLDGLRAVHYEFCIPAGDEARKEVMRIDTTLQVFRQGPGRVGCGEREFLCIGSTHQPRWMEVLSLLTGLPYVERIEETFFEE